MSAMLLLARLLGFINSVLGRIGQALSVTAIGLMVVVILIQVFCRYVLNNALPWPDEAARFLMLWLTGLMAPVALRQGGFVAIDTLKLALPSRATSILSLVLLVMTLAILVVAVQLGANHVKSGWLFASSSLKVPLDLVGMKPVKIKLAWSFLSLYVGVWLMIIVSVELILREIITILGSGDKLHDIPDLNTQGVS